MKRNILLFAAMFLTVAGYSQEQPAGGITSGKIIYREIVRLDIKLEGDAAQFAESLPKEQISDKVLYFNSGYSLYQNDEKKKEVEVLRPQTSHMNVRMMISGGNDKIYSDLNEKKKTEQKEFMTRTFLVAGELGYTDWKLTGNTNLVLGYSCQEAVREENGKKVSVWFTSSIPVSTGPSGFGGLPGMILSMNFDDGNRTITATNIDPGFDPTALLLKPTEGKKVTSEEFKKILDEKRKEMGSEGGEGGAHVIIRIQN